MTLPVSGGVPEQGLREVRMYLDTIKEIIEAVDERAMAADGPVTPTLKEMTQAEMTEIYESAVDGSNRANEFLAAALERPRPAPNNVVACVSCKQPVNVTALNAIRCEKCRPALPGVCPQHRIPLVMGCAICEAERARVGAALPPQTGNPPPDLPDVFTLAQWMLEMNEDVKPDTSYEREAKCLLARLRGTKP